MWWLPLSTLLINLVWQWHVQLRSNGPSIIGVIQPMRSSANPNPRTEPKPKPNSC